VNTRINVTVVTFVADSAPESGFGLPSKDPDAGTAQWSELLRCEQVVRFYTTCCCMKGQFGVGRSKETKRERERERESECRMQGGRWPLQITKLCMIRLRKTKTYATQSVPTPFQTAGSR